MLLDATNKSLKVILGEAKAVNDCDFVAIWADITSTTFTPGATDGTSNGTTAALVVDSPAGSTQRQIKSLQFYNNDTVSHTITVQYLSGANTRVLYSAELGSGVTLTWSPDTGWVNTTTIGGLVVRVPMGRLTLTSATPVLTADVTGATTVYYTPYIGNQIPVWNGTSFVTRPFSEMSQTLADTTKSPAATTASHNYDMFIWDDNGTLHCTRGPAWTSDTARGTGAGTTQLSLVNGIYSNTVAVTNGPAAGHGTYVGSIRTNGSNQVPMVMQPAQAAGGAGNILGVWNMWNRVPVAAYNIDNTASWNYTTATVRAKNASGTGSGLNNSISFIVGIAGSMLLAVNNQLSINSTNGNARYSGIGYDSITAMHASSSDGGAAAGTVAEGMTAAAIDAFLPDIGYHYVQALEYSNAAGTTTWYGVSSRNSVFHMVMDM